MAFSIASRLSAGGVLNPAKYFFDLAFGELEIVIRKRGPLLFQLTFGDVPVAFDFQCIHSTSFGVVFPFAVSAKGTMWAGPSPWGGTLPRIVRVGFRPMAKPGASCMVLIMERNCRSEEHT